MSAEQLRSTVLETVNLLVHGNYDLLVARCASSRLTAEDLRKVILDYGRRLTSPPTDAYQRLDAVLVKGAGATIFSVRAPLWTEEEGRSDLTLELTITLRPDRTEVELDDLHVL